MKSIKLNFQHKSKHNKICSYCNADNTHAHSDINNSTPNGNKRKIYRLTADHRHLKKSTAKQCWIIESTNIKIPKAIWLEQWLWYSKAKQLAITKERAHVYWKLWTFRNLTPNKTADINFLPIPCMPHNNNISWTLSFKSLIRKITLTGIYINETFYHIAEIIATLKHLTLEWK